MCSLLGRALSCQEQGAVVVCRGEAGVRRWAAAPSVCVSPDTEINPQLLQAEALSQHYPSHPKLPTPGTPTLYPHAPAPCQTYCPLPQPRYHVLPYIPPSGKIIQSNL